MSSFARFQFPPDVILLAVRWYLRYNLSYRDLEEMLAERGVEVDHVTLFRWVQRFTPMLAEAARPCRHAVGGRWFVDETYVKVAGVWRYVYRAVDEHGQVIDVMVSKTRDIAAARKFFDRVRSATTVVRGRSPLTSPRRCSASSTSCCRASSTRPSQRSNNRVECDHGRLKARLRPMRGLKTDKTAAVVIRGHAFIQNLRRGHYELGVEARHPLLRLAAAFDELVPAI